jgi:hypothetical protein
MIFSRISLLPDFFKGSNEKTKARKKTDKQSQTGSTKSAKDKQTRQSFSMDASFLLSRMNSTQLSESVSVFESSNAPQRQQPMKHLLSNQSIRVSKSSTVVCEQEQQPDERKNANPALKNLKEDMADVERSVKKLKDHFSKIKELEKECRSSLKDRKERFALRQSLSPQSNRLNDSNETSIIHEASCESSHRL